MSPLSQSEYITKNTNQFVEQIRMKQVPDGWLQDDDIWCKIVIYQCNLWKTDRNYLRENLWKYRDKHLEKQEGNETTLNVM